MDDPVLGPQIRGERVKLWNDQLKKTNQLKRKKNYTKAERDLLATLPPAGSKRVRSYDDILTQPGGDEWDLARVVTDATKHSEPKYRLASGAINPKVPEHLRDLPIEPEKVTLFGPIYNRMLEENQRLAKERGLSVFAEQWRVWDRIRKQVEPHESMHRDISKLPRMSAPELFDAYAHQKQAGFHSSGLKRSGERYVSPFDYRKGMAWGTGAAALPGLGMVLGGEEGDI